MKRQKEWRGPFLKPRVFRGYMIVIVSHSPLLSPYSFVHGAQSLVLPPHLQQTAGPVLHQLVTSYYQRLQLQLRLHR